MRRGVISLILVGMGLEGARNCCTTVEYGVDNPGEAEYRESFSCREST